jgi:hypothetical protein
MLDQRSQRPIRVTRLSMRNAFFPPLHDHCSEFQDPEFLVVEAVANLRETGPRESTLIMMAAISMEANMTSAKLENVISNARLMAHPLQVSGPRCRSTTHVEPISDQRLWEQSCNRAIGRGSG